jgi:hypothetical protein
MTQQTAAREHEKPRSYPEAERWLRALFAEAQSFCSTFPLTLVTVQAVRCSYTLQDRPGPHTFFSSQIRQKCLLIKAPPPSATRFSLNWDYLTTHIIPSYITTSVHIVETTSPQSSCHTPKNGKLLARSLKKSAFDIASAASQSPTLSRTRPTPVA